MIVNYKNDSQEYCNAMLRPLRTILLTNYLLGKKEIPMNHLRSSCTPYTERKKKTHPCVRL